MSSAVLLSGCSSNCELASQSIPGLGQATVSVKGADDACCKFLQGSGDGSCSGQSVTIQEAVNGYSCNKGTKCTIVQQGQEATVSSDISQSCCSAWSEPESASQECQQELSALTGACVSISVSGAAQS